MRPRYAADKALFGELAESADFQALLREQIAAVYALTQQEALCI